MKLDIGPGKPSLAITCCFIAGIFENEADFFEQKGWTEARHIYNDLAQAAAEWSELPSRQIKPAARKYAEKVSAQSAKATSTSARRAYSEVLDTLKQNL